MSVTYRLEQKKILLSNIAMIKILMKVIEKGYPVKKENYFYGEEEEEKLIDDGREGWLKRRISLRFYLRKLNQLLE